MRRIYCTVLSALSILLTYSGMAVAAVEPPAVSDARSAALGGTGVAYSDNGAAVFHNPAGLAAVDQGAVTLSVSPFLPRLSAPIGGASEDSTRGFFPMFLVGGGFRIADRMVLGVAVYPVFGFGAEYTKLAALGGEDLSMSAAAFEASPALCYSISDAISVGVGYRATYMLEDVHQVTPQVDPNGNPILVPADMSLSGFNFLGFQLGVLAKPTKSTRIGLTYRNKVTVDLDGEMKSGGVTLNANSEFAAPHTFKLGVAQEMLDRQLMLTLDLKYAMYSESSKRSTTSIQGMGSTETPLNWKDSLGLAAGAEYRLTMAGPALRLGYSLTQSATPEEYPQPFLPPPGLMHAVHAGGGMQFSHLDVDLGAYYTWSNASDVPAAADAAGEPGDYGMNAYVVALSATYRL